MLTADGNAMISVEVLKGKAVKERAVEVVEGKGKGHPDYICDSIMDAISVALCERYMGEFGTILHHNIDKGLLQRDVLKNDLEEGSFSNPCN